MAVPANGIGNNGDGSISIRVGGTELIKLDGTGVSLNGVTPAAQAANVAAVAVTGVTQTTPYGFSTSAQGDALVAAVNSILVALKNAGIMASA